MKWLFFYKIYKLGKICSMDNNNELDDQRIREEERTLFISRKSESILLHIGCTKKVVQECNLDNLMMQERSDFGPVEVDAESQNKRQFQNFEDHRDAITMDSSSPDHENSDSLVTAQEVTLKMLDTMDIVNMRKEDVDSDRALKSESISMVGDSVDCQRASLFSNQNKADLPDHRPNDFAFPKKIVPSDNISLGPLQGPGSVSCRSTSSTTSGRSFAFPVLSGEWIGSPVKMAGSGRGHMKRNRWWRRCFGSCIY